MTSILDQPVRVDRDAERLYYFGGRVSVDLNGSETERKQVLEFLVQAQQMARVLLTIRGEDGAVTEGNLLAVRRVLRDAGVQQ